MDNDDAMVGQILTRREAMLRFGAAGLGLLAGGAALGRAVAGGSPVQTKVDLYASPAMTEGPFFVDEKLNRSNVIGDTKREAVIKGLPLHLEIAVYTLTASGPRPLKGAHVDIWHCDAIGVYSDESHPMNSENTAGQHWLRGYQVTDEKGIVHFDTIYPGWYPGRSTHIHFKVRTFNGAKETHEFTSQWFFDEAVSDKVNAIASYSKREGRRTPNPRDGIYSERQVDGTSAGSHLMLALSDGKNGKVGKFSVGLRF
jgi:protocatechuate 3,4-dioxygenase beta subunit